MSATSVVRACERFGSTSWRACGGGAPVANMHRCVCGSAKAASTCIIIAHICVYNAPMEASGGSPAGMLMSMAKFLSAVNGATFSTPFLMDSPLKDLDMA